MPALNGPIIFPIPPDANFDESLSAEFLTDIKAADAGNEFRAALRDAAVRTYSYTASFGKAADALYFRSLWLAAPEPLRFIVPLWPKASTPTAIGGTTITGDFALRGFTTGLKHALLWQDNGIWELVDISTISDTVIGLTNAVVHSYVIGAAYLIPTMVAWMDPPVVDMKSADVETVPVIFREEMPGVSGTDATAGVRSDALVGSMRVYIRAAGSPWPGRKFATFEAVAFDQGGVVIPQIPILWTISRSPYPLDNELRTFPYDGRQFHVSFDGGTDTYYSVEATAGGVTSPAVGY